ncbi:hypothetical protein CONLIGDRAFT_647370 [Coniochaeta ligniaria NRRL 30616]|uniref:Uncharacterized protein n=1 Tax=Coniochaeta ligniaria NRRL 30616 TaxID=1408157 RepID=A0A1J7J8X3_9PEZI|nr:hypothetical protein CONLIGDRAFT_647370 [Coniochaeta ligniaria NRRL 30616]
MNNPLTSYTDPGTTAAMAALGGTTITALCDVAKTRLAHPDPMGRTSSPSMNTLVAWKSPQTVVQPSGLTTGQKIGIGVGVGVALAVGVGAGFAIKTAMDRERDEAVRRQRLLLAAGIEDAYSDARSDHLNSSARRMNA